MSISKLGSQFSLSSTLHHFLLSNWYTSGKRSFNGSVVIHLSHQNRESSPLSTCLTNTTFMFMRFLYNSRVAPAILFQTPGIVFLEIQSAGLFFRLWMPLMTRHHSDLLSVLTFHHPLGISAKFRAFNEPNPSPPEVFGATTFSHDTQLILFLFSSPPHTNLLLIFSKLSITPAEATKIEKKYMGKLPNTACASVIRPPNHKVFDF